MSALSIRNMHASIRMSQWLADDIAHSIEEARDKFTDARDALRGIDPEGWSAWYDQNVPDNAELVPFYEQAAAAMRQRVEELETERIFEWLGLDEAERIAYGEAVELAAESMRSIEAGRAATLARWKGEADEAEAGRHVIISGGEVLEL